MRNQHSADDSIGRLGINLATREKEEGEECSGVCRPVEVDMYWQQTRGLGRSKSSTDVNRSAPFSGSDLGLVSPLICDAMPVRRSRPWWGRRGRDVATQILNQR